ncbi:hypothetical protein KAFR_0B06930 [Kazachstania africana CBS 2517]|uniref:DHHA2 domain-containing protein n=1 Tax=Kazachstania africana (strain ATCC 22294 / BCRC 22015 / CBS 2517 / CECT 1963 / NBRC 1671 / NRRL Y-8276) TaxID=1071382 RepID=H2ARJ0_KAZAF|nr:hypothetical protein KAFR_0B06930 [Kazachstania africana CBS 2517]CCF56990.1 hypothetical protein KAFR_0B06930 [Kazachstania africana CBS 2517]
MALTLKDFLRALKTSHVPSLLKESNSLKIVCGNEAADFDSIASAISYSYLNYANDNSIVLPVISIPKNDLLLRRDVIFVLDKLNITTDLLFFLEDLYFWKSECHKSVAAVLVDHNDVMNGMKSLIDDVIGIIDHHEDQKLYLDVNPRTIETCGSCTSLVFRYWYYDLHHDLTQMVEVIILCLGAAIIDTNNFQYKVESKDLEMLKLYQEAMPNFEKDSFFYQLKHAKNNIYGLSVRDILRKDYKQFDFISSMDYGKENVTVGVASIVKPLQWLQEQHPELLQACIQFKGEYSLDVLVLMTSFSEDSQFKREIAFISDEQELQSELISKISEELKLEPVSVVASNTTSKFKRFNQLNLAASRKQVVPVLKDAFASYSKN